jgi:peptidoglycan/LPS O-acetylase OafA/YrhL
MDALDAIRGMLALLVFAGHVQQIFIMPFQQVVHDAVVFFFCLSGYVITLSIERNYAGHSGFAPLAYVSSRAWRVLPALLGVILITLALEQVLRAFAIHELPESIHAARQHFALDWHAPMTCLATACFKGDLAGSIVGPLWTLAYEIQLYFIAGLAAYVLLARSHLALRIAVFVAVAVALKGNVMLEATSGLNIRKVFFCCFAFGAAARLLRSRIDPSLTRLWPAPLLAALVCMGDYFAGHTPYLAMYSDAWLLTALVLFGLSFSMLLWRVDGLSAPAWLVRVGGYSYTRYILHFPVLLFAFFALFNVAPEAVRNYHWPIALVAAGVVWWLAMLSARLLEDQQ